VDPGAAVRTHDGGAWRRGALHQPQHAARPARHRPDRRAQTRAEGGRPAHGGGDGAADRDVDHRLGACGRRPGLRGLMRAAADVGGTFTDVLLRLPTGELAYHKVLSTPPSYDAAVVEGIGELLGRGDGARLEEVVHGTTVATNAVL